MSMERITDFQSLSTKPAYILYSVSAGNKIQDMVEGVRALPSELVVIAVEEPWLTTVTTIVIAIAIATSIADGL